LDRYYLFKERANNMSGHSSENGSGAESASSWPHELEVQGGQGKAPRRETLDGENPEDDRFNPNESYRGVRVRREQRVINEYEQF
jgi:hypothetical protein